MNLNQRIENFYSDVSKCLEFEYENSLNWKRKQNINLLRNWIYFMNGSKISFQFNENAICNRLASRKIDETLFDLLWFPNPLNFKKNVVHRSYAIHLSEQYLSWYNNLNDIYMNNENTNDWLTERRLVFSESNSPFPLDYILNLYYKLHELAQAEPNNYELRPPEAYHAGICLIFKFHDC